MKSKFSVFLFSCVCCLVLTACEQDEWADWRVQNQLWLEQNKTKEGVQVTHTGLQYKVVASPSPSERRPNSTSLISASYKGTLIDGTPFDPSTGEGTSTYYNYLSSAIAGWQEGIQKMHVHDTYIFYIPYNLAYGEDGSGTEGSSSFIPPYSTLIFEVTLTGANN